MRKRKLDRKRRQKRRERQEKAKKPKPQNDPKVITSEDVIVILSSDGEELGRC